MVEVRIDGEVGASVRGLSLAYVALEGISGYDLRALDELVGEAVGRVRASLSLEELNRHPIVRAYRDFYWRVLKIDPTKQRPAAEALARRILRGRPMPRIHPLVDLCNAVQLLTMLCIGVYDLDRVSGSLVLRRAKPGEVFHPIGSPPRPLRGNELVLSDCEKLLHVFPHRDSTLTAICSETVNALAVVCGVPGIALSYVRRSLEELMEAAARVVRCELSPGRVVHT
mgnify:CR=1 FL=1